MSLSVAVPVGVGASVAVPPLQLDPATAIITLDNKPVFAHGKRIDTPGVASATVPPQGDTVVFEVLSGYYNFETKAQ